MSIDLKLNLYREAVILLNLIIDERSNLTKKEILKRLKEDLK